MLLFTSLDLQLGLALLKVFASVLIKICFPFHSEWLLFSIVKKFFWRHYYIAGNNCRRVRPPLLRFVMCVYFDSSSCLSQECCKLRARNGFPTFGSSEIWASSKKGAYYTLKLYARSFLGRKTHCRRKQQRFWKKRSKRKFCVSQTQKKPVPYQYQDSSDAGISEWQNFSFIRLD